MKVCELIEAIQPDQIVKIRFDGVGRKRKFFGAASMVVDDFKELGVKRVQFGSSKLVVDIIVEG